MKMKCSYILTTSLLAGLSSTLTALPATPLSGSSFFTYNRTHFLLNGEPFQIIGGQMDPQRIPREFWRDRLRKARAMGLNTIFPYVMWNMLEPEQGTWDNTGVNDIAAFFRIANEEDLKIILRPGPYICGERDWGGLPAWLATIPGMVVRTSNGPFLEAAELYFKNLAKDLAPLQINQGGPILMIQVENEYGSYGENHEYTKALRDMLRVYFNSTLYTNDGTEEWTLKGGSVPEVLAEIDGDPRAGFSALRKYITDPSQQGPLLDGEYYTHAPDQWGSKYKHGTTEDQPDIVKRYINDLGYVLGNESASISLYMVHGGTNFGFSNGALWQDKTIVWTSSYDYGSPIDESGRTTELYHTFRETIQKYVPAGRIPDVPKDLPRMFVPEFKLSPMANLFDNKGKRTSNKTPLTMEALGQLYGFTLYEYTATEPAQGFLQPGDRPRDRILVYVNGVQQGVIDGQYQFPRNVTLNLQQEDKLQLLVENLGRVNYYSRGTPYRNDILDPFKGIKGNITLDEKILEEWDMYSLGLEDISSITHTSDSQELTTIPLFYNGSFQVNKAVSTTLAELDTYLAIPAGVKGNVWVNGFHLGRYWRVGPQQSLYLPGAVVKAGGQSNEVVVLELEPHMVEGAMTAIGYSDRIWGNNPDIDCLDCI